MCYDGYMRRWFGIICAWLLAAVAWGQGQAWNPPEMVFRVRDYRSACEYLLEQAIGCEEEIWMQIDDGVLSDAEREKLFFLLPHYRLAEMRVMVVENTYKLLPSYKSCVRMLGYFRGNTAVRLTPTEKKALQVAENLLRELRVADKSDAEIALALHDWIVLNCEYDVANANYDRKNDTNGYNAFDGKYLLLNHKGVCDSYVQAYWMLLQMAGVPCSMMSGQILKDGEGHGWNLVYLGDHWAHVDVTFDDPVPDRKGEVSHANFDKSDAEMEQNRRWARDVFPNAKGECFLLRPVAHYQTVEELTKALRGLSPGEYTVEVEALRAEKNPLPAVLHAAQAALPHYRITAARDPFYPRAIRLHCSLEGLDTPRRPAAEPVVVR